MVFKVFYRPEAETDLQSIFNYVADAAGIDVAETYEARIRGACARLGHFPNRGTPRDDLAIGLRTIPFEPRAVIAYLVEGETVRVARILHGGRDLKRAFAGIS